MTTMEQQYLALCRHILKKGNKRTDRTGTGTLSIFGAQLRCDLNEGFPLLTTKKVYWKGVVEELLWMLAGRTDVQYLQDRGVRIWDKWAKPDGTIGPGYGFQWRNFGGVQVSEDGGDEQDLEYSKGVDQIRDVLARIVEKPDCRRLVVTAWNPEDTDAMALPPCHMFFQFYVHDKKLSCQMYQRSADMFLGVPFNIASYALLTHLVARHCDLGVGEFIHSFGDAHIYSNHVDQMKLQLKRRPRKMPELFLFSQNPHIFAQTSELIDLVDYNPHPAIRGEVSV